MRVAIYVGSQLINIINHFPDTPHVGDRVRFKDPNDDAVHGTVTGVSFDAVVGCVLVSLNGLVPSPSDPAGFPT